MQIVFTCIKLSPLLLSNTVYKHQNFAKTYKLFEDDMPLEIDWELL